MGLQLSAQQAAVACLPRCPPQTPHRICLPPRECRKHMVPAIPGHSHQIELYISARNTKTFGAQKARVSYEAGCAHLNQPGLELFVHNDVVAVHLKAMAIIDHDVLAGLQGLQDDLPQICRKLLHGIFTPCALQPHTGSARSWVCTASSTVICNKLHEQSRSKHSTCLCIRPFRMWSLLQLNGKPCNTVAQCMKQQHGPGYL